MDYIYFSQPDMFRDMNRYVFENITNLVLFYEPESSSCLHANASFCKTLGYSTNEILNLTLPDLCHCDDRDSLHDALSDCLSIEETACCYRIKKKDESFLWIQSKFKYVKSDNDKPGIIIAIANETASPLSTRDYLMGIQEAVIESSRLFITPDFPDFDKILKILGQSVAANRAYVL